MLSVQITELSVHAVLDCSSVMQWMVVVKVRVECGLSIFNFGMFILSLNVLNSACVLVEVMHECPLRQNRALHPIFNV